MNIAKRRSKLIKIFTILIALFTLSTLAVEQKYQIENLNHQKITLRMAITRDEHTKGLSGLRPSDFKNTEGMLFINAEESERKFWMPDTYFNLDIIFLNKNLDIIAIEKNVSMHPGTKEPPSIYRTGNYFAQYILEVKANSLFSKDLKAKDHLIFYGPTSLQEIVSKIHLPQ
jgi:uncharacterized membrane protein (UPF0127 family)